MTIIDRYISREFVKIFFLTMISFTLLYLIVDFFGRIRMFLSNNATFYQIAAHFFYGIPQIISHTMPVAVLLASLLTFGTLSRHNEIVAMRASGLSLYRTALPLLFLAGVISACAFLFNEFITPFANQKAKYIEFVEVKKQRKAGVFKQNQIWYRSKNAVYNFGIFVPETNTLKKITINYFSPGSFNLVSRVDAREAVWKNNQWVFTDVLISKFTGGEFPVIEKAASMVIDLPERPSDIRIVQKDTDEMGFFELRNYIKKIESEGYDATRYLVDMHGKIAFTLVNVILVVLGISFSLGSERSGGVARSIGTGVVIGFSYWIVFALAVSLGRSLTLPPFLAAWSANIVFAAAAAFLFMRVKT
ncbi:MAG: LPS export ABC transporter permease LptG [Syntrophales bacterium]